MQAPAPALLVISGGPDSASRPIGIGQTLSAASQRLLNQLPAAQKVLELGCETPLLAQGYKLRFPQARWTGLSHLGMKIATDAQGVDVLLDTDLHLTPLPALTDRFDLIVIHRLELLPQAATILSQLISLASPECAMYVLAENHACLSFLTRLVETDVSTGTAASPSCAASQDLAQPRMQSPSTIYKMLLDAGWTPTLADGETDDSADESLNLAAYQMRDALGLTNSSAERIHRIKHMVIRSQRLFDEPTGMPSQALFDVVVPTNNDRQLRVNVEQSPGLREVQARILSYRKATSPAQALSESLPHVQRDWVLLCHQDVYFPHGFGEHLNQILAAIPDEERATTLLGFVGKGVNRQTEQIEAAGFVIDRLHMANFQASDSVVSIDEFAVVVAKESVHQIDPLIGWHLWATDLCLTSICTHRVFPRIVRLPVFHNSLSGWRLPDAFYDSAQYLRQKFPDFQTIHTLCGDIDEGFVARNRSTQA